MKLHILGARKTDPSIWTKSVIVLVKVANHRSVFSFMVKGRQPHKVTVIYRHTDRQIFSNPKPLMKPLINQGAIPTSRGFR